eukprot:SAG22_NODE_6957_length_791_cov_1.099711_1_plen_200_part_10
MIGPGLFWLYIFLMYFILMSVFIALIAESYETARHELEAEKVMLMSRQPATGDDHVRVAAQRKAQHLLREMRVRNMISRVLEVSLRKPLDVSLAESGATLIVESDEESWFAAAKRVLSCRRKSAETADADGSDEEHADASKLKGALNVAKLVSAWPAPPAKKGLAGGKGNADDSDEEEATMIEHPVDTFTDDDDDVTMDE